MSTLAIALPKRVNVKRLLLKTRTPLVNLSLIFVGSIIWAVGMNAILVPHEFISGGTVGLAMLIHYMFPAMSLGTLYFLLNIPLAVLGWMHISRRFMYYSFFGIIVFSVAASLVHPHIPYVADPILAALFAGVVCGGGGGLILRSLGSAGGFDILGVFINKKYGFRIGMVVFLANALVLAAGAVLYDLELTLYSIIFFFTCSKVVDVVMAGFNTRKSLLIISDMSEVIGKEIINHHNRGVTYLKGMGAYSGKDKDVIFTIITLTELPKMKEMIFKIDPQAFVVVNDTVEVLGKRHGQFRVR
jgi:uncharacterized membrane-anchored protein YitT (DUF2179 family)